MRIASVILSLLAHGTAFLYLGSFTLHERQAPAVSGNSLRVALVRTENRAPIPPVAAAEPVAPLKPRPEKPAPQPQREAGSAAADPHQFESVEQLLASQLPTAAGRMEKPAIAAVPKKRVPAPVVSPALPTVPRQAIAAPQAVAAPIRQPAASVIPADRGQDQPVATDLPDTSMEKLRELERSYVAALVAAIERHKRYPLRARKKGYEGEVQVLFTVLRDGTISRIEIGSSSFREILDQAAARAVRDLGRFVPIPPQLGRDQWEFQVPIRFAMN